LSVVEARGIALVGADPQPQPRKILDMVGLTEFLGVTMNDDDGTD
jgi:hypothetical protein